MSIEKQLEALREQAKRVRGIGASTSMQRIQASIRMLEARLAKQ